MEYWILALSIATFVAVVALFIVSMEWIDAKQELTSEKRLSDSYEREACKLRKQIKLIEKKNKRAIEMLGGSTDATEVTAYTTA